MALTFRGGVRLDGKKMTADSPIVSMPSPDFVTIPLLQHKGEPCKSLVKVGDRVLKGQCIANSESEEAPIHASVSGYVREIKPVTTTLGEIESILIENDRLDEISPEIQPFSTPISLATPEEIVAHIRKKGIVGMGGKGFPTWRKIEAARGKVRRIIINCAESEPYLTVDHRLLLEKTNEVVGGVKILLRAVGAEKAIFAITDDKEDAIDVLNRAVGGTEHFGISVFRSKYPQGDEKYLIRALSGKEVPAGGLPVDLGVVTFNVETCWSIYRAFVMGLPVIERILTVSGECIKNPQNLLVPLGTSFEAACRFCGGFSPIPDAILSGGPMMGEAVSSPSVPVTRCVGAILALKRETHRESACIRCGRCVKACPVGLMPMKLLFSVMRENPVKAEDYGISSCNECGLCTYVCPARIELLEWIRQGKGMLQKEKEDEKK